MAPDTPYKGLRFYRTEDSDIFAAREQDAVSCARLLAGRASVIMLHGRTGCGKSSFLRAALSPLLENAGTGLWFPGAHASGFRVARSGQRPLREIARHICEFIHDSKDRQPGATPELEAILGDFKERSQIDGFIAKYGEHYDATLRVLSRLGAVAPGTPIFVIDQAEEIFTLAEKPVPRSARAAAEDGASNPDADCDRAREERERLDRERERELNEDARVEYMNLLRSIALDPPGVKFLISLRTEYKGLFEDELRRHMSADAGPRLTGFHLDDLDFDGLVQAIKKPSELSYPDENGTPLRFRFDDDVPEEIAKRLLEPTAVPMGGVLPTLQVVCSRLYEQTRRSKKATNGAEWPIQLTDLDRLGDLDNQVEVYLRERLEEMLDKFTRESAASINGHELIDRTTEIDKWYRLLEHLVRVQGDGRAVTRQVPESLLVEEAGKLECKFAEEAWPYLGSEKVGILRAEPKDGVAHWTLGHDSLGLAIQKWSVTYKESLDPGMRMDMNSPRQAARLTGDNLFPKDAQPQPFAIVAPDDALWDHQIPFFTELRNLSRRIGIEFVHGGQALTREVSSRVLVAAERAAFPPAEERHQWTDVAVSDLFQGNGLVGPPTDKIKPVRINVTDEGKLLDEVKKRLGDVLHYLAQQKARLLAYDKSADSMIALAASLAGVRLEELGGLVYEYDKPGEREAGKDSLFEKLAREGHHPRVFMIGTAFGRAQASHRGYRTYFDCQDLTKLIDLELKRGRKTLGGEDDEKTRELFRLYRESAFHTVWQLNIPSAEWRQVEHYPLIMRLAGLCYFTADYIRSFADDFVRHLYDWHAQNFAPSSHVTRETIREVLRDCFVFLSFDENPRLLFDPSSRYEFNPRDSAGRRLTSTVREIHIELTKLRKRTVDLFDEMCWETDQIKRLLNKEEGGLVLAGETLTKVKHQRAKAEELRRCAWDNFRIYNYYDSARLMEDALRLVGEVVAEATNAAWNQPSR